VKQAQAQHFIPVAHLARFSDSPTTVPLRRRVLHLYDKRSGSFRSGVKAEKVAFENDLYTIRNPDLGGIEPDEQQIVRAVFDSTNKAADMEELKAEIEEGGVAAMRTVDGWEVGPRAVSEEDRAPLLIYIGLLLAQHPTMMARRIAAIRERFWAAAVPRRRGSSLIETVFDEMCRGMSVLAMFSDGFAAAYELNQLAWKVIRWPGQPGLILGDVGVAAWYPQQPLGIGDLWTADAKFLLPTSPTSVLVLGGFAPGACLVEDRSGPDAEREIGVMNVASWARSRSEVYAAHRDDLDRALAMLGPLHPQADHSVQLRVRASALPDFRVDDHGNLEIIQPPESAGDEVRQRFEERFNSVHTGEAGH
jgi:hypothetical protein